MANIIDGKQIANELCAVIKDDCARSSFSAPLKCRPTLAIMRIGNNPASDVYVRNKMAKAAELGIACLCAHYPENRLSEAKVKMRDWAEDPKVNGIILQLPAPGHEQLAFLIPSAKDVDGFFPDSQFSPCTPKGIIHLLHRVQSDLSGLHAVVVGRSEIVGRPLAQMLLDANCTVTVCHSKTTNLGLHTRGADILIAAAGKPSLITADMVKPGAIVIDVGINRVDGKLTGDVDFEKVKDVAGWITPVPGGVGPMTVASLMENVCLAWRRQNGKE